MTDQHQELETLISKGHSAAWDQKWNDAAAYYQQALEIEPKNLKALTSLGLAYYEMHDFESALEAYRQAAAVNPEDPAPYEKMYLIYEQIGEENQAVAAALRAADAHLKNEDIQKAVENWKRVIALDVHNVKAHARLAMVYQRLGKKKLAVSEFINSASILQHNGNTSKALEAVDRALQFSPENIIALRAKEIIQQGRQLPLPEPPEKQREPEMDLGSPRLQAPEPAKDDQSVSPIEEAVEKAMSVLAEELFREKLAERNKQTGDENLRDALRWNDDGEEGSKDDSYLKLHISQAIENFTAEEYSKAAESIKLAIDEGYSHPAAFFMLGYLYLETGRLESAARNLNRAVSRADFSLGSRLLLARNFRDKEMWREASTEYIEALRIADTSLVPREEVDDLIHLYEAMIDDLENQEGDEALVKMSEHIDEMLIRPDWREVLTELREKGDLDGAVLLPQVDGIIEDRRSQVMSIHKGIQSLVDEGRYGAAMERAFFALQNAPTFLPLHVTIGDILLNQGKKSGAVAKYLAVADVYTVQGKTERALSMLKRVIDLQPMNIEVRLRQIHLLEEFGQYENAIVEYINLADVYWTLAELESAREACEKALENASDLPGKNTWEERILHRLADIDIQRLDWDSALQTYQKLISDFPRNQKASIAIVDLNFRLGKHARADKEIERFINQYPLPEDRQEVLSYLQALKDEKPGEVSITRRLAAMHHHLGDTEKAIEVLDSYGDMLLDEGRTEDVILVIEDIIALNPPNAGEYQKLLAQLQG